MEYKRKARLAEDIAEIAQYRHILERDKFQAGEMHWNSISKNTITLFQVLIDQDLTHLVTVLEHYPRYVPVVCEHFRYAYSYSENAADIGAVSTLLFMGEAYFTKQFVRNVMRKLPGVEQMDLDALQQFALLIAENAETWHPIVTKHYCKTFLQELKARRLHPLQHIALSKRVASIELAETYNYEAEDRDAALDIPYMN